jgi:hypothetical protein
MELSLAALIGLIAGLIAVAGVLLYSVLQPQRYCPDCGTPLPKFGQKYARPGWWGGWICPNCRCEIDRRGKSVK